MNSIAIGPLILSNDRFIAVLTIAAFLLVAEVIAWRRRDAAEAIRRWSSAAVVIWIIAARAGHVLANWEGFAPAPWTVLAIWQGGFDIRAGTAGLGATLVAAFLSRSRTGGPLLIGVAAAAAVFGIATLALRDDMQGRLPTAGLADLSGLPVSLADRDGRPLVLNLWATWCPPCRREMPMMVDVARSQDGVDIVFANQGEPERIIRDFLGRTGLANDAMIRDPNNTLMQEFGLQGLPSTLFFAADGSLKAVHTGEISRAALLAGISDLKAAGDARRFTEPTRQTDHEGDSR